jgi:hypothetical protein
MSHHCHWPNCQIEVPPKLWGCIKHWYSLPKYLRDKIWKEYKPGQEITKTPSIAYISVANEVQEWIKLHAKTPTPTRNRNSKLCSM